MRQVDIQALSVEEAVRLALEQLGRTRDQVKVEVLATDPGGEEVLVRVTAPDLPGQGSNEEASPRRGQRTLGYSGRGGDRPGPVSDFGNRTAGEPERIEPGNRADRDDRGNRADTGNSPDYGNRAEARRGAGGRFGGRPSGPPPGDRRPRPETFVDEGPAEVELDSSLQVTNAEAATPQDAVAPVAAEILQRLLQGMRIRGTITRRDPSDEGDAAFADDSDSVVLNVTGVQERDQGILIGRRGETLDAVQFLVNLVLSRKIDLWARIVVDVEGYRLRRKMALINLARRTAEQVDTRKQAIPLEAMSPSERRIVHMTLADHPSVTTESSGVEPDRRVVVLPR